jgi:hypothetical protein
MAPILPGAASCGSIRYVSRRYVIRRAIRRSIGETVLL